LARVAASASVHYGDRVLLIHFDAEEGGTPPAVAEMLERRAREALSKILKERSSHEVLHLYEHPGVLLIGIVACIRSIHL